MADEDELETTENRVYLFRELARAFVERHGDLLASDDAHERERAMRALSLLAFASCEVADGEGEDPAELARRIAEGP
jgi:hypothetical protein